MICAHCGKDTTAHPCAHCGSPPLLDGRYRLELLVGQGASACTYRATDPAGQTVAIKELPLRRAKDEKALELFHREARVLRQISHPAIPRWIEDFITGEGKQRALYIVQDFVEGASLADELDDHRYDADEVLDIMDELAGVLDYLHSRSPPVIHRDIKPDNILRRDADGRLMLVDFGSVRDSLKPSDFGGSTVTGTFGYMAPEQYRGDATPRSDLYGLGALCVTLLSRRPPHTMLDLHRKMHFRDHVRSPPPVLTLLDQLLEVDPDKRLPSALAVQQAVDGARGLIQIGEPPASAMPPLPPMRADRHRRGPLWRIAAPIIAVVAMVAYARWDRAETPTPPEPAIVREPSPKPTPTPPKPADNAVVLLPPSEVPSRIRLHHSLNDRVAVRECFRHHGAGVRGPVDLSVSVAPPNVLQEVRIHRDGSGSPRLVRCLLVAIPPARIEVPFVRHWEGKIQLVRSDYPGNWTTVHTAPTREAAGQAVVEATRPLRNRCITPTQSPDGPRHIGVDFKIGDNGVVSDIVILPKTLGDTERATCIRDALASVTIAGIEVANIWWWWEGAAPEVGEEP